MKPVAVNGERRVGLPLASLIALGVVCPEMSEPAPQEGTHPQEPASGPKLLFFSGGTALRAVSRELPRYTHESVHVITPFDSGGSSAELRRAFHMPAVGDLRNRLLALAYAENGRHAATWALAATRFDNERNRDALMADLEALCDGDAPSVTALPENDRSVACRYLAMFRAQMPADFDLRGASLGNLLLTGAWLESGRRLEAAAASFSRLVGSRGTVLPVVDDDLHLVAELEDGSRLFGQHTITGKEMGAIASPVRDLWLTRGPGNVEPVSADIEPRLAATITDADLVCFPMGSFYSSIVANLLPRGVGKAVARARAPRVYIPNLGHDPESLGLGVFDTTLQLVRYLQRDFATAPGPGELLDYVLVDTADGAYAEPAGLGRLEQLGINVVDRPLVTPDSAPLIDAKRLIDALLSLAHGSSQTS